MRVEGVRAWQRQPEAQEWTVDVYETEAGEKPVWSFIAGLEGRNRVEARG